MSSTPTIRITGPESLLSALPHLLGYQLSRTMDHARFTESGLVRRRQAHRLSAEPDQRLVEPQPLGIHLTHVGFVAALEEEGHIADDRRVLAEAARAFMPDVSFEIEVSHEMVEVLDWLG